MYVNRKIILLAAGLVIFLLGLVLFIKAAGGILSGFGGIFRDAMNSIPLISSL